MRTRACPRPCVPTHMLGRTTLTRRVLTGSVHGAARASGRLRLPPIAEQGPGQRRPGGRECVGGGADAQDAGDQVQVRVGTRVGPSVSGNPLRGGIMCLRVRERQGARVQRGGLDGAPLVGSTDCGLSGEEEEEGDAVEEEEARRSINHPSTRRELGALSPPSPKEPRRNSGSQAVQREQGERKGTRRNSGRRWRHGGAGSSKVLTAFKK